MLIVAATLGLLYLALVGIAKVFQAIFASPKASHTESTDLDKFLSKPTIGSHLRGKDRAYIFLNCFAWSFALGYGGALISKDASQMLIVASVFLTLVVTILILVLPMILTDKQIFVFAFPFSTFAKRLETKLGALLTEQYNERFKNLVEPYLQDIAKYAELHANRGGELPFPVNDPLRITDDDLTGFHSLLSKKGCGLPGKVVLQLLRERASLHSVEAFKNFMLAKSPELAATASIDHWSKAYVLHFEQNLEYLPNLIVLCTAIGIAPPKGKLMRDQISSAVALEIKRLSEERTHKRIQDELDGKIKFESVQIEDIDSMDGHQFEKVLEALFASMGYSVQPTSQTGDQGADIIVEKLGVRSVVQAKRYSDSVGNKAIQEAVGAKAHYKCSEAIVVTNNQFTRQARELAASNTVELWDRVELTKLMRAHPQRLTRSGVAA